jgi:hypothetical protein
MDPISRRSLLKGFAALPVIAALEPLSTAWNFEPAPATTVLNVWFHGLFALVFDQDGITALTPYVKDHVYRAQPFINNAWGNVYELAQKDYKLVGAPSGLPRPAKTTNDAIVEGITQIDYGKSYLSVRFPFPNKVSRGRSIKSSFSTCPGNPHNIPGTRFPLIHQFTYQKVSDSGALKLDPDVPFGAAGLKQLDLHIYAEPDDVVSTQHANDAFAELMKIFPQLCLTLNQPGVDPNQCPPIDPYLNKEQQLGLAERDHKCKAIPKKTAKKPIVHHFFGVEAADCSQIIVNPGG